MKTISLDAIDRKILKYLVKNARMPFLEIARECGISGAAIHQRIHKLTEAGVILGSYMVVDPKMLGFDVCAHINISLKDPQQLQQVIAELARYTELPLVAQPNAGLPLMIDGKVQYPLGAEQFAEEMKKFLPYQTAFLGGCCGTSPDYIRAVRQRILSKP